MGIFSKNTNVQESSIVEYDSAMLVDEADMALQIASKLNKVKYKGEVELKEKMFPVALGEEHPFDFSQMEGLYKRFGFANGVVEKFLDFVIGPGFYVESDDERAKEIINDFMENVNFDTILRAWGKEAMVKGTGFLEIGGSKDGIPKGVKVRNANYMYVKRDRKGNIEKYNQYTGGFKRFDKTKVIDFDPWQVSAFAFNCIGDDAYGLGVLSPGLVNINGLLQNQNDLHMLMNRKANSPYDVSMGKVVGGKYYKASKASIDDMGKKLEWLHNKHEWVHDGLTEIKALDFGNIGEKFNEVLEYDTQMLFYTFQVPSVLMGTAGVSEGLAKIQMDAFERRIKSIQQEWEKVIEKDLFQRILIANGITGSHVEFQWGQPSNTEKADKIEKLKNIMVSPMVSETLRGMIEADIVRLLGYNEDEYMLAKEEEDVERKAIEEEERKREENRPQPIIPGSNAKKPKPIKKKEDDEKEDEDGNKLYQLPPGKYLAEKHPNRYELNHCDCKECKDYEKEYEKEKYDTIKEWVGFEYTEYKEEIIKSLQSYGFSELAARNIIEEKAGMLSSSQVNSLKKVLTKGFNNGESIAQIKNEIRKNVKPKDLLKIEKGKIVIKDGEAVVVKNAKNRELLIARTEITRAANKGALEYYKKGGISKKEFVASFGARTCPECADLDGNVYEINSGPEIPVHPMCRCTWIPVTSLSK